MNYLNNASPLPKGNRWTSFLWSQPAPVGLYTKNDGGALIVTTNQRYHLGEIPDGFSDNILILDAGGFSPPTATALSVISRNNFGIPLGTIIKETGASSLVVPISIAQYMQWADGQEIYGLKIQIVSNNSQEWGKNRKVVVFNSSSLNLIIGIIGLYFGQALVAGGPLIIFGMKPFLWGQVCLLVVSLISAIAWGVIPIKNNILKGIIVGLASIILLLFPGLSMNFDHPSLVSLALGLFISSCWMGIVLNGTKT